MVSNSKIFEWNIKSELQNIEMTVGLPALNSEKILWLPLESLKNQIDINFKWELICFEDYGSSLDLIKTYIGLLPNCVRIVHYNINPILDGRQTGKFKGKYILIDKWINISKIASKNSKIFVMHDADDFSPTKRLYIHYEHFKNKNCYLSTQKKGVFINLKNKKKMLYNGDKKDGIKKQNNIFKNNFYVFNHLNKALLTKDMKKIKPANKNRGIDNYIRTNVIKLNKLNCYKNKHIFIDEEIDKNNWKFGFFTDGYNNISISRSDFYDKVNSKSTSLGPWMKLKGATRKSFSYKKLSKYIPEYILKRLGLC